MVSPAAGPCWRIIRCALPCVLPAVRADLRQKVAQANRERCFVLAPPDAGKGLRHFHPRRYWQHWQLRVVAVRRSALHRHRTDDRCLATVHGRARRMIADCMHLTGFAQAARPCSRPIWPALYFYFAGPSAESRYVRPQGPFPWSCSTASLFFV